MKKGWIFFLIFFCAAAYSQEIRRISVHILKDDQIQKNYPYFLAQYRWTDRETKIYAGTRLQSFYYYEADSMELREEKLPLEEFFLSRPDLVQEMKIIPGKEIPMTLKDLVFYDSRIGQAKVIVEGEWIDTGKNSRTRTEYLLTLDLKSKTIVQGEILFKDLLSYYQTWKIDAKNPPAQNTVRVEKNFRPAGYDPDSGAVYFMVSEKKSVYTQKSFLREKTSQAEFYRYQKGKAELLAKLESSEKNPIGNPLFFHEETQTLLAMEYTERGKNGFAYLIDGKTKNVKKIQTPLTCYSAIFDPDGKRLYLQSSMNWLWVLDLRSGKVLQKISTGPYGFLGGFVRKEQLVFANAHEKGGILILSTASKLKVLRKIPAKEFQGKTSPYGFLSGMPLVKENEIHVRWDADYPTNACLYRIIRP